MKEKPGVDIAYLSKSIKGSVRYNVPFRWTNRYQQYYILYIFTTYAVWKDLEFNPSIFGTETSDWSSVPPSLPHSLREKSFFKNSYPVGNRCVRGIDLASALEQRMNRWNVITFSHNTQYNYRIISWPMESELLKHYRKFGTQQRPYE